MKIQMLISTVRMDKRSDLSLEEKNIKDAIIINQLMPKYSVHKSGNYTMYNYNEQGLSKSRNRLLENMTGDIGVITDDDISFTKDALKVIEKAYKETDADIITFNLQKGKDIIGKNKKFTYNHLSIMSVCSCQITFKRESIMKHKIKFDENFGLKAQFTSGEENIFLSDCLKHKLKIIHIPIIINSHPEEETTGEIWDEKVIKSKGALMYRLHKYSYFVFLMYFAIMKHKDYKKNYGFFKFIKIFNKGKKEYKKLIK